MASLVLLVSVLKVGDGRGVCGVLRLPEATESSVLRPKVLGVRKVLGLPRHTMSPGLKVKGQWQS